MTQLLEKKCLPNVTHHVLFCSYQKNINWFLNKLNMKVYETFSIYTSWFFAFVLERKWIENSTPLFTRIFHNGWYRNISGIGKVTIHKYFAAFLAIVKNFDNAEYRFNTPTPALYCSSVTKWIGYQLLFRVSYS